MMNNKIANILAATVYGPLIVNRFDYYNYEKPWGEKATDGVGHTLLETSTYEPFDIQASIDLIKVQSSYYPGNLVLFDIGANIGIYAVAWSKALKAMHNSGAILSIEAQEWIFYSLCGNVALNNCYNVRAIVAAISDEVGHMEVPTVDYTEPLSYGSIIISNEFPTTNRVPKLTIDSMEIDRLDFMKIDVETMEQKVLNGAENTIMECRPLIMLETFHDPKLGEWLVDRKYKLHKMSTMNTLAIPEESPVLEHVTVIEEVKKDGDPGPDKVA